MTYIESLTAGGAIGWLNPNLADLPLVAVNLMAFEASILLKGQFGEMLPRTFTKGLTLLGRVDAVDTYAVLLLCRVQDRQGVTVRDRDDAAGQFGRPYFGKQ